MTAAANGLPAELSAQPDRLGLLSRSWRRHGLAVVFVLYAVIVLFCTWQRGIHRLNHTTFPIFRGSYYHLLHRQDLYALYPAETGRKIDDLFKYSPTAALLFAPFALPPLPVGLLLWNAFNAGLLAFAVRRVLGGERAALALLLLAPEVLVATQASSSNCLLAALLLLTWVGLEHHRPLGAAFGMVTAAFMKIFPLAWLAAALLYPRRIRFGLGVLLASLVLAALPLLVVPPGSLAMQYHSWWGRLTEDATIHRGASVMRLLNRVVPGDWPNWPVQLAGVALLLLPLAVHPERRNEPGFRLQFLCSLLVWVVIFNHEAERQSFVISSTGIVLWFVSRPATWPRGILLALCLLGLKAPPQALGWGLIQFDLLGRSGPSPSSLPLPVEA